MKSIVDKLCSRLEALENGNTSGGNTSGLSEEKVKQLIQNTDPKTHTHKLEEITDLQTTLDTYTLKTDFDTHTHPISDITDLQTTLDGKASSDHTHDSTYVKQDTFNTHTHPISDITDLQTTLDGKASSDHTHDSLKVQSFMVGDLSFTDPRVQISKNEIDIYNGQENTMILNPELLYLTTSSNYIQVSPDVVTWTDIGHNYRQNIKITESGITINDEQIVLKSQLDALEKRVTALESK